MPGDPQRRGTREIRNWRCAHGHEDVLSRSGTAPRGELRAAAGGWKREYGINDPRRSSLTGSL
jgi:hypothetical protein